MKKIAAVCNMLIILSILIGCSLSNNPMQNEEQLLLEKEKKTQVLPKSHTKEDAWYLRVDGIKDPNLIWNDVDIYYKTKPKPSFRIVKLIKKSGEINFYVQVLIGGTEYKKASSGKNIQIQLADSSTMEFDCKVYHHDKTLIPGHVLTRLESTISIKNINRLRTQKKDAALKINLSDEVIHLTLPALFFEYLREI